MRRAVWRFRSARTRARSGAATMAWKCVSRMTQAWTLSALCWRQYSNACTRMSQRAAVVKIGSQATVVPVMK